MLPRVLIRLILQKLPDAFEYHRIARQLCRASRYEWMKQDIQCAPIILRLRYFGFACAWRGEEFGQHGSRVVYPTRIRETLSIGHIVVFDSGVPKRFDIGRVISWGQVYFYGGFGYGLSLVEGTPKVGDHVQIGPNVFEKVVRIEEGIIYFYGGFSFDMYDKLHFIRLCDEPRPAQLQLPVADP